MNTDRVYEALQSHVRFSSLQLVDIRLLARELKRASEKKKSPAKVPPRKWEQALPAGSTADDLCSLCVCVCVCPQCMRKLKSEI